MVKTEWVKGVRAVAIWIAVCFVLRLGWSILHPDMYIIGNTAYQATDRPAPVEVHKNPYSAYTDCVLAARNRNVQKSIELRRSGIDNNYLGPDPMVTGECDAL